MANMSHMSHIDCAARTLCDVSMCYVIFIESARGEKGSSRARLEGGCVVAMTACGGYYT